MTAAHHPFLALALSLALALLCGCLSAEEPAAAPEGGKVKVVASTLPLGTFASMVGGDLVEVAVLVPPGASPHTFEPTPSKLADVAEAELYIKNGAGLEIWMERMIQANRKMLVVDTSSGVELIETAGSSCHEKILAADPHIWLSPKNAMIIVEEICDGLVEVDPENAEAYRRNRDDYLLRLEELDRELESAFSGASRREFIVLHPAWSYLARDYALVQVAILEGDKEPGPRYLAEIVEVAREENLTTIFVDPNFSPKSGEIIAGEIGGRVVPLDPLAEDYIENMRAVSREIGKSLEG